MTFANVTSKKLVRYRADGTMIQHDGTPLRPGESLRIQMTMMDAAGKTHTLDMKSDDEVPAIDTPLVRHTRGFVGVGAPVVDVAALNAQAESDYLARKDRMSRAWMLPVPLPASPPLAKKDSEPAGTDVDSLLDARDQRLTNAWRTPAPVTPVKTDATVKAIVPSSDGRLTATEAQVDAAIAARDARLESAYKAA